MEQLNRTLTGINTIYEMQLKSISTQVGTIDQINDQTRKYGAADRGAQRRLQPHD
jgi:hypothetical protein